MGGMRGKHRIASGFGPFSPCSDRFTTGGYRDPVPLEEQFRLAAGIEGLSAVCLDYPSQLDDLPMTRELVRRHGFAVATVAPGIYYDRRWKLGTFANPDPGIRREAVELAKRSMDVAAELGAEDILVWPAYDGFDYPFEADYLRGWGWLVEGIGEAASHRSDVRLAVEYKKQEIRTNLYVRNAGTLLGLLEEIGLDNVGGVVDYGHSLAAGENPAEAAVLLHRKGRLYQVHVNDNYRDWDHDMIPGTVSFWETLEFFYWLRRLGYAGWYIVDIFPYRLDGAGAFQDGVRQVEYFLETAGRLQSAELEQCLMRNDKLAADALIRPRVLR